jgi:hypothetical protein
MPEAYDFWMSPRTSKLQVLCAAYFGLRWPEHKAQPAAKTAELFDHEKNITAVILQTMVPA